VVVDMVVDVVVDAVRKVSNPLRACAVSHPSKIRVKTRRSPRIRCSKVVKVNKLHGSVNELGLHEFGMHAANIRVFQQV
jgi:hypothetical protein